MQSGFSRHFSHAESAASAPWPSTGFSAPRNWTESIRKLTSATCSRGITDHPINLICPGAFPPIGWKLPRRRSSSHLTCPNGPRLSLTQDHALSFSGEPMALFSGSNASSNPFGEQRLFHKCMPPQKYLAKYTHSCKYDQPLQIELRDERECEQT
jgi:hypothetical protein